MPHIQKNNPWIGRFVIIALLAAAAGGTAVYFSAYPERLPEWSARTDLGREMQTTRVYKWQDASGAWHVSDTRPPGDVEFTVQEYNSDDNVLPLPPDLQN